ncbi:hypothetical protein OVN18_08555 [Microcella daejeonensis]|uniref:Uncharacterized protein n=1 Tax=Microcella daejeonensis TaxID=2994971 RepID=A0A9E8S7X7_9MICO|nr:hypothetical protein [Microcella daejeonensis]WAB80618.1 hypothetical protein OVN18_08555 [Microcella daejeonensis]
MTDAEALRDARAALAAAAARLEAAGIAPDQLATTVGARRVLGVIPRSATMRRTGEGWRLGVLIATREGDAWAPATTVRATRQQLPGHQAESAQQRRALRLTALSAGFDEGAVVDLDARLLPLDDPERMRAEVAPLVLRDGVVLVRWMPSAPDSALRPLADYLHEREQLALLTAAGALDTETPAGEASPVAPTESEHPL